MRHFKNETGTDLILDTGILIGSATQYFIKYQKPSGLTGTWTATLYDSYSDLAEATGTYLLKRTLLYTDLTEAGEWRFQAHIGAADGTWWGETAKENILDQFEI